jgi:hypothetical protein
VSAFLVRTHNLLAESVPLSKSIGEMFAYALCFVLGYSTVAGFMPDEAIISPTVACVIRKELAISLCKCLVCGREMVTASPVSPTTVTPTSGTTRQPTNACQAGRNV